MSFLKFLRKIDNLELKGSSGIVRKVRASRLGKNAIRKCLGAKV